MRLLRIVLFGLLTVSGIGALAWYGWFIPSYRAHCPPVEPTPIEYPEAHWEVKPFPSGIFLVYSGNYEVTIRPVANLPNLQSVTIRYDPKPCGYWRPLNYWAVVDSFLMPRQGVALRSHCDRKQWSMIMRISYPQASFRMGIRDKQGKWFAQNFEFNLTQPSFVHHSPLVRVFYLPDYEPLALPAFTKSDDPAVFNGLEVEQPGTTTVYDILERNAYVRHQNQQALLALPFLLAPFLAEAEVAVEGTGEAVLGTGEVVVGEATEVAGEAVAEGEEGLSAAGRFRAGLRVTGASWWGAPEEAYEVDANGLIRTTEWLGAGRIVGEVSPSGQILRNSGFAINGQAVKYVSSDGSLFSYQSVNGFIGKIQPNGSITSFFGEKIGSVAR